MCLALKHYGFEAFHRFALTPSPLSPRGEGETTITARERHFFVCQIAKQVPALSGLTGKSSINFTRVGYCHVNRKRVGAAEQSSDEFFQRKRHIFEFNHYFSVDSSDDLSENCSLT